MFAKGNLKSDLLVSLSLSNFFFLGEWLNFFADGNAGYEAPAHYPASYLAMLAVVSGLYLLILVGVRLVRAFGSTRLSSVFYTAVAALFIFPLNALRVRGNWSIRYPALSYIHLRTYFSMFPIPGLLGAACVAMVVIVVFKSRWVPTFTRNAAWLVLPFCLVTFGDLGLSWAKQWRIDRELEDKVLVERQIQGKSSFRRVVWVVFDELDQRLLMLNRPLGFQMPEFDQLRHESVVATHAYPPAANTIESIPALLTGRQARLVKYFSDDLLLKPDDSNVPIRWSAMPNVFRAARRLGYRTSLAGWFHNYCQIFHSDLDGCYRHTRATFDYSTDFLTNVRLILSRSILLSHKGEEIHLDAYERLLIHTIQSVSNPNMGLIFVHVPVPHAPWIYDADKRELTRFTVRSPSGYLGNLLLADITLGRIRRSLEQAKLWNNTLLIVSADHSWRESRNYDGNWDPRVPFLIRLPDSPSQVFDKPIGTIHTSQIALALLAGRITTTDGVMEWLERESLGFRLDVNRLRPEPILAHRISQKFRSQ